MPKKKALPSGVKNTLAATILSIFGSSPFKPLNYKQISKSLSMKDKAGKDLIHNILVELAKEGKLIEDKPYRYTLSPAMIETYGPKKEYLTGRVDMKSTGKAYVTPEKGGEDVFISDRKSVV